MTNNEDIERKMNFIVEQQAQFASDIQQLQESQSRTEQVVTRTVDVVARTAEAVTRVSEVVSQTVEAVAHVGEAVERLANETREGFNDGNAKINALVDAQIRTDERIARTDENLNKLLRVVDRHLDEGENGK